MSKDKEKVSFSLFTNNLTNLTHVSQPAIREKKGSLKQRKNSREGNGEKSALNFEIFSELILLNVC